MKQLLSSCFALCSSAVLASSFALFAPEAAQAFTLIDDDNDMLIDGIAGLEIDGSLFNVDFISGSGSSVYSDGFTFDNRSISELAISAIVSSLGGNTVEDQNGNAASEFIHVGYAAEPRLNLIGGQGILSSSYLVFLDSIVPATAISASQEAVYAVFEEPGGTRSDVSPATTPEPSLILGFITLSGLMLGSKRKTKG